MRNLARNEPSGNRNRFWIENGCYWLSDRLSWGMQRPKEKAGGKFINYSWLWKDNLWSITEVTLMSRREGQTQKYGWERRGQAEGRTLSHQQTLTPPCSCVFVYVHSHAYTSTDTHRGNNLSYRDRRIDWTPIKRGQTGNDRPFASLVVNNQLMAFMIGII